MPNSATWLIYQPLIVGLGAVILASLGNTALEWYRHHLQETREARTLRRAFLQELQTQRRMFARAMTRDQKDETDGTFMVPVDRFLPVYDQLIGKIGVLEPAEVGAVLEAYAFIELSPKNLGLIGQVHKNEFATFINVDVRYAEVLANMNDNIVETIDAAISELSKR